MSSLGRGKEFLITIFSYIKRAPGTRVLDYYETPENAYLYAEHLYVKKCGAEKICSGES